MAKISYHLKESDEPFPCELPYGVDQVMSPELREKMFMDVQDDDEVVDRKFT